MKLTSSTHKKKGGIHSEIHWIRYTHQQRLYTAHFCLGRYSATSTRGQETVRSVLSAVALHKEIGVWSGDGARTHKHLAPWQSSAQKDSGRYVSANWARGRIYIQQTAQAHYRPKKGKRRASCASWTGRRVVDQHVAKEIGSGTCACSTIVSTSTYSPCHLTQKLQKEKIDLENTLEQEKEYMVNRLQKQLELLRQQQQQTSPIPSRHDSSTCSPSSIPASPVVATATVVSPISRQVADPVLPAPPGLLEVLRFELINLRARALEMEKECKYISTWCTAKSILPWNE